VNDRERESIKERFYDMQEKCENYILTHFR